VDLIILCTRHNLHGRQTLQALQAGKHVLAEKPLCLTEDELRAIEEFYAADEVFRPLLTVGFNRRFSRYLQAVTKAIAGRKSPLFLRFRMNAGYLPPEHWAQGPEGGGRIAGEACHIMDAARSLIKSPVVSARAASLHPAEGPYSTTDNKVITLEYEDGSLASLEYFAVGSPALSKECLEVHFDGKSIMVDNFQSIKGYGLKLPSLTDTVPDKGQMEMLKAIGRCILGRQKDWPIPLEEIMETTALTLALR
jgi:predicted dehydrogenase